MENVPLYTKEGRKASRDTGSTWSTEAKDPQAKWQWLARERCVHPVRLSLPALIHTFEDNYEENGDAEAYGLAKLLRKYKFAACLHMLCDILHTDAKIQGSLQAKQLNLAMVPIMVYR